MVAAIIYLKLRICCFVGLCVSIYATYVEVKAENNNNYKALCDLSPKVSCTAVFNTPYGKSFGLLSYLFKDIPNRWNPPNGLLGIIYYLGFIYSTFFQHHSVFILQIFLCVCSNLLSIYLAYLLYYVLKNFCVICISIYVINFLCLCEMIKIYKKVRLVELNKKIK
uniref:vitamin-K-epoxide reductase (warfarin-sensitive) n=1 Tax=Glossina brevipalpis TaxID=37001 RepID=A0A1A9WWP4_9MUSC